LRNPCPILGVSSYAKNQLKISKVIFLPLNLPILNRLSVIFINGGDWYIAVYDEDDIFEVSVIFNGEWGCISFTELRATKVQGIFEIDYEID